MVRLYLSAKSRVTAHGSFNMLIGCYVMGPRRGRFVRDGEPGSKNVVVNFAMNSNSLRVIGVSCLWFGWYSFNASSVGLLDGTRTSKLIGQVTLNTTLSAATCGLFSMLISNWFNISDRRHDLDATLNGILAGLVSITAGCNVVKGWGAVVIGIVGTFVWIGSKKLVEKLQIDDVVDAIAIHAGCGIWGLIAPCFFAGIFYGGNGKLLGAALISIICIVTWTSIFMTTIFTTMEHYNILRISEVEEVEDLLDWREHGHYNSNTSGSDSMGAHRSFGRPLDPALVKHWVANQETKDLLDKPSIIALAMHTDSGTVMETLALFDRFSGGAQTLRGDQFDSFLKELSKRFLPTQTMTSASKSEEFHGLVGATQPEL
eukprot:GSChrysophyteH1.ASY1.ANO1.1425.1 assembled CDS